VKQTVNFDDPESHHLYYGDETGRPGTILTFFVWPGGWRGRQGTGQVGEIAFAVPAASLGHWLERLMTKGVKYEGPTRRFGEQVLAFTDPDGIPVQLVAHAPAAAVAPWIAGPVPAEHAVRGIHSVTIWEDREVGTERVLAEVLGLARAGDEENRTRFRVGDEGSPGIGRLVDLRRAPGFWRGGDGVGTVHHVAFRAADDAAELALRARFEAEGMRPTPQIDRRYFHSVYVREPGGVLFEIATDAPGFTVDEPVERLGSRLQLPPQFESARARIEERLAPIDPVYIHAPTASSGAAGGSDATESDAAGR
jgi:catechol 2,3-dioxygenase-like lactoylglutathione lyase family enzyme